MFFIEIPSLYFSLGLNSKQSPCLSLFSAGNRNVSCLTQLKMATFRRICIVRAFQDTEVSGLLVRKVIYLQCSFLITTRSCSYPTQFSPYESLALLPTVSYMIDQMFGVPDIFFLHRVLGYITQTGKPSASSSKILGLQTCRTTVIPGTFEISFSIFQPDILASSLIALYIS